MKELLRITREKKAAKYARKQVLKRARREKEKKEALRQVRLEQKAAY